MLQWCVFNIFSTRSLNMIITRSSLYHVRTAHACMTLSNVTNSFPRMTYVIPRRRQYSSKVPWVAMWEPAVLDKQLPNVMVSQVPADLVDKLERLALVDFRTKEGLICLERAIQFADQLHVVNTDRVEPMDSVLEERTLQLRDDAVMEGDIAEELLQLSRSTIEEYFVAPPGNIPLPKREERTTMLQHSEF